MAVLDAEAAIIGALLIEPTALANVSDWLSADDFADSRHSALYRIISELVAAGQPADAVTIAERLMSGDSGIDPSYPVEIASGTASAANIEAYAEIVLERSRVRRLSDIGAKLVAHVESGKYTSNDLAAQAINHLSVIAAAGDRGGLMPTKPYLQELFRQMVERHERGPGLLGLATPWAGLNKLTSGLLDGTLYVIGARPSMGKSVLAGNLCTSAALSGKSVGWFSVEQTAGQCLSRALASVANVPLDWVRQPVDCPESEQYWARYNSALSSLLTAPLLIDETAAIRIEQVMARARRAHMRKPLDLVVIDHLHDMHKDPRASEVSEIGRLTQGAKTLAKELDVPVVLMAQLNRASAVKGARPTMTDLRASGEIEQKADAIFFLHRPDYYDPDDQPGVVELIPAKARDFELGRTIYLRNNFAQMRLDEWDGALPERSENAAKPSLRAVY